MPFRDLYFTRRFWIVLWTLVGCCIAGYFLPALFVIARMGVLAAGLATIADMALLFRGERLSADRDAPERLSNGDENLIHLSIENRYPFPVAVRIIDDLPDQFQRRDFVLTVSMPAGGRHQTTYALTPVTRGEYRFGDINVYVSTTLGLAMRRYRIPARIVIPVYPAFLQMRRYELLAASNRLTEAGLKRVRRIGHTMEFEHIRKYVPGDDYRTINWKAAARRGDPMVNAFEDERSQPVFSVIDMSRVMKMPFHGMSLLDYAINAALVISNIVIRKQDRAGILTFSERIHALLPADRRPVQLARILELLYNQTTRFGEADYGALYATVAQQIPHRSLLLLFTQFETFSGMRRQLPYLRRIAGRHLLVVLFFQNVEMKALLDSRAETLEAIYIRTVAEQLAYERRQIVKELERHGIQSILTTPQTLTVDTINKYLELKARRLV